MNGRALTLGFAAGLAAASTLVHARGSRALAGLDLYKGQEMEPAQPWKRLVGAARGGPALQAYQRGLARLPLDVSIDVVRSVRAQDAWLQDVRRPAPGKLRISIYARSHGEPGSDAGAAVRVQTERNRTPSDAFALYTPFVIAHRLFDSTYSGAPGAKLAGSQALSSLVMGEGDAIDSDVFREWAMDDSEYAPVAAPQEEDEEDEDARMEAYDEVVGVFVDAFYDRWAGITDAYEEAYRQDILPGTTIEGRLYDKPIPPKVRAALGDHVEASEETGHLISRVLASLACPTAAGRLLRLTDGGQAMSDCYATWVVSGRNPLLDLTEDDFKRFSPERQVARWLASEPGARGTPVQAARYQKTLEEVAVPVLRWLGRADPSVFRQAASQAESLVRVRLPLIHAANDFLAIQRVMAI